MIGKLVKSYAECEDRWDQGDRNYCPKDCSYHKAFFRKKRPKRLGEDKKTS